MDQLTGDQNCPINSCHLQVESSKQSAYKLLKVLSGLRDWEICAPDVSAAVEFCRQNIVEMSVDEYEEWFQQVMLECD